MRKHLKLCLLLSLFLAIFSFGFADTVSIGSGTGTSTYFPIYGLYGYNYTQQIVTQSQINTAGVIEKIRFYYMSGVITNSKDWTIYIGHTDKTSFESNTDWVPLTELTQVYSGDVSSLIPAGNNWMEIPLATAFDYNNTDNLVIAVDENTPGYGSMTWGGYTSGTNTGIYYYSDGTNPDPANPPTASNRTAIISRLQLIFPTTSAPHAPTLVAPIDNAVNQDSPVLSWQVLSGGDPDTYDLYLGTDPNPPLFAENLTQTSYLFSVHGYETDYYWKVVAKNGFGPSPASEIRKFTTRQDPNRPLPYIQDFNSGTTLSAIEWSGDMYIATNHGTDGSNGLYKNLYSYTATTNVVSCPIGPMLPNSELKFDYRFVLYSSYPNNPKVLAAGDEILVQISTDNGATYTTIHTIDQNNHTTTNQFTTATVNLSAYSSGNAKFKLITNWGSEDYYIDIDNFIVREVPNNPVLLVYQDAIDFGSIIYNTTSAIKNVTVSNFGGGTLHLEATDIAITGANSDIFHFDDSVFPFALEAGDVTQIPVFMNGTTAGDVTANLEISYDGNTTIVALSANILPEGLVIIGDGTANNYMPVNTYYGYSYAQMLYRADEIMTSGRQIEKIAYHWNGAGAGTNSNQWTVYMGHTDKEAFASTTDWIALADLVQVYQGTLNIPAINQWIEVELNMPFVYNGADNLVIAVRETKPSYDNSSYFFYNTASTTGRSIRYQNDSTVPNPAAPPIGTLTAAYPNIKMYFGDIPASPVISVSPNNINFGSIFFNATSDIKNVTVANTGAGTLQLNASDVEITGTNAALFSFDDSVFPFALETGISAQIPVFLVGTVEGDVTANLEITYAGNTEVVALSANVLPDGTVIIGDGTSTQRNPMGAYFGYERSAAIYTMTEIGSAGMIESIGWNVATATATVVPYKIYLGTTSDTQLTAQTFSNLIANMTLVHEGDYTFSNPGWNTFNLASPFLFAGGNLVVAVETNYGGGGAGSYSTFYYTSATATHMTWNTDNNPPTTNGSVNANRPNLMLSLGELTGVPELSVNPAGDHEFPLTLINTTVQKEFTVANIGGGNINVTNITITGDGFALAATFSPVTIGSGQMHSFIVEYSPTAAGNHSASLQIESDAGDHSAELTGSCFDPTITVLPHTENFDSVTAPAIPAGWTVLNPDNTSVYWRTSSTYSNSTPNSMYINYTPSTGGPLNDWFITPPVALEAGKEYRVSFYYRASSTYGYENLGLYFGSSPTEASMTELLWSDEDFNRASFVLVEETISPTADGSYFFGWYAYSGANEYGIYVDSIKIEELSPTPVFAVEPNSYDFGEIQINTTSNKSIKVSNIGGGQLGITAIEISDNAAFELGTLPTLPAYLERDEFINFDAIFAPTAAGDYSATITITDDQNNRYSVDAGSLRSKNTRSRDAHTVALTGSCFDPTIRTFPFFEGFEDGNTHDQAVAVRWTQLTGPDYTAKKWTANNTLTTYNRTPKSGTWNAFLQYSGESTLIRPIMLEANKEYKLKFYARQDGTVATNAKIKASFGTGNTLADLTQPIIAQTGVIGVDYQEFSGVFSTETSGLYYIGINGWINNSPWYLSLDDISIDYNYVATPDAPTDIDANTTVTIVGAGFVGAIEVPVAPENLTPIPNTNFIVSEHQVWELIGTGTVTLTFNNNDIEEIWIAYVVGGAWVSQIIPAGGSVDIDIELGAKDAGFEFALGKGGNPTLPVELSYFNAVFMISENSVKLSWKTESETQMLGYQIYRSTNKELANAIMITPTIINASNNSTGDSYSYLDREVENGTYYYWLEAVSYNSSEYYGYQTVVIDIPSTPELPEISSMSNAYPNPFKDMTNVDIAIKGGETGSFTIYNMLGQVVYKQKLSEGNVKIEWHGRDNHGNRCGSGVYFYKLVTPTKSETKKMVIMK